MGKPDLRNRHEPKPDQEAGFKDGHQPSTRVNPKMRVGNSQREPWTRQEGNREKIRLTGQWRDHGETFHLFINQAGTHIELLIAFVESRKGYTSKDIPSDKSRIQSRLFRMGGDLDASQADRSTYHLYAHYGTDAGPTSGKDIVCGSLRRSKEGKTLQLALDVSQLGQNAEMAAKLTKIAAAVVERIGTDPNLFENHLCDRSVPAAVRTMLWFPLTPRQSRALPEFIFNARVRRNPDSYAAEGDTRPFGYVELVEHYFGILAAKNPVTGLTLQQERWLTNIAEALDVLVGKAMSDASNAELEQGGIDAHQADYYWKFATLEALDKNQLMLDPGHPRTLLTLTQAILDGAPNEPSLERFESNLGLAQKQEHQYEAEISLVDLDGSAEDVEKVFRKLGKKVGKGIIKKIKQRLPFGTTAGTLEVKKTADGAFKASYVVAFGGMKISISKGSSGSAVHSTGLSENAYGQAWRPENIPGPAIWSDVGASGHGGGKGFAAGVSLLTCMGSGATAPRSSLGINFTGPADAIAPGAGGSINGMLYAGLIVGIESSGGDVKLELPKDPPPIEYKGSSTSLHFPINRAGLTQEGTDLVEIFAACELYVLTRPSVRLELHGYADQPDTELKNLILSRNRAITVYNFLKNILGSDLPTGELKPLDSEKEEIDKAKFDDERGQYNIEDPSINSVKIVAHGETPGVGDKGKPQYDAEARRVDLHVSGIVSLSLKRRNDK